MATRKEFADFVLDQIDNVSVIEAKKMFGEYGLVTISYAEVEHKLSETSPGERNGR